MNNSLGGKVITTVSWWSRIYTGHAVKHSLQPMLFEFLSSRHGAFSGSGWTSRPPDMDIWRVAANILN